jgi:uncharacterized membrane protein YuzA (DUF378 family)
MAKTALVIAIIGALNWLLVGLFQWDLVAAIFGGEAVRNSSIISRIIFVIVGLSGIYAIRYLFDDRMQEAK